MNSKFMDAYKKVREVTSPARLSGKDYGENRKIPAYWWRIFLRVLASGAFSPERKWLSSLVYSRKSIMVLVVELFSYMPAGCRAYMPVGYYTINNNSTSIIIYYKTLTGYNVKILCDHPLAD